MEQTQKDQFIQFRAEGLSFETISKKLKKAKGTLIVWEREFEQEIANSKALHLETLYEKYFLLKQSRLTLFGETLIKIKNELDSRTLTNIPTEKLIELLAKYHGLLQNEYVEYKPKTEQEQQESKQEKQEFDLIISLLKQAS